MALTLNNLSGFETDGLEEAGGTVGSPAINSTAPVRTGDFSLKLDGAATAAVYRISPHESVSSAGDDLIMGFAFRANDVSPTADVDFLEVNAPFTTVLVLRLKTTGDLKLVDAGVTEVGSATTPFTVDTWHFIELRWQNLDSGAADVFIDGISVISVTGQDFKGTGSFDDQSTYVFQGGTTTNEDIAIDDFYCYSGATGTGDLLGGAEVFRYQNNTASQTPDTGDATSAGNWENVGETPGTTAECTYTGGISSGDIFTDDTEVTQDGRHGPHGDTNVDGAGGTIKGAKYLHQMKRGTGGTTVHRKRFGNSADAESETVITLATAYENFFTVSAAAAVVPLESEHFSHGMSKNGGARDMLCKEIWSFLLHVPSAGPAVTQPYYHRTGGVPGMRVGRPGPGFGRTW